jgi:mannosyltransferase
MRSLLAALGLHPAVAERPGGELALPAAELGSRGARRAAEPPGGQVRWGRTRTLLAIAGPCALTAVLVGIELGRRSLWLDEGATVAIVSQHGAALWAALAHDGGNMLAFYLLLHVLVGIFGDGTTLLRLPAAVATVATVGVVSLLGARLFDRRVALAGALLTAVSLPLIFWGQDARGYAPLITFITASFYTFTLIVQSPAPAPRRLLVAYGACTALAAYMQIVTALIVPAQLLVLLIRREHARAVIRTLLFTALACLPLFAMATLRGASQLFWVPSPNIEGIGQTLRWLTSSAMPPNFHVAPGGNIVLIASLLALWVAAATLWHRARESWPALRAPHGQAWREGDVLALAIVLGWITVPLALSLAESAAGQPILLYRNSVICLPAVALAIAWAAFRTRLGPRTAWLAVGGLLALRAVPLIGSYGVSPENWKAAEAYVVAHTRPGDCIAFYPRDGRMAFDYYVLARDQSAAAPRPVDPSAPWTEVRPYVEDYTIPAGRSFSRIQASCPRIWFIASHQGQLNGPPGSLTNYIRYRIFQDQLQSVYEHFHTRVFGWAAQVRVELLSDRRR